jgi:hypothetical protein
VALLDTLNDCVQRRGCQWNLGSTLDCVSPVSGRLSYTRRDHGRSELHNLVFASLHSRTVGPHSLSTLVASILGDVVWRREGISSDVFLEETPGNVDDTWNYITEISWTILWCLFLWTTTLNCVFANVTVLSYDYIPRVWISAIWPACLERFVLPSISCVLIAYTHYDSIFTATIRFCSLDDLV